MVMEPQASLQIAQMPTDGKLMKKFIIGVLCLGLLLTAFHFAGKSAAQTSASSESLIARMWLNAAALGLIPGTDIIHKFGERTVSTTPEPVTLSGFYRTPTAATALEFVSDSAADDAVGLGAQEITIQGLDSTWMEVTQTLETDGTTPVALSMAPGVPFFASIWAVMITRFPFLFPFRATTLYPTPGILTDCEWRMATFSRNGSNFSPSSSVI